MRSSDDILVILPHRRGCRLDDADFLPGPSEGDRKKDMEEEDDAAYILEEDGCTPCYFGGDPVDDQTPCEVFDNTIVGYWQTYFFGQRTHCVLQNQLKDWKSFRRHQRRQRNKFNKDISLLRESLNNERRNHKRLDGDVPPLSLDPREQGYIATWIEFQHYHLEIHERLRDGLKHCKEEYDRTEAEIYRLKPEELHSQKAKCLYAVRIDDEFTLKDARQSLRWHKVMQNWIQEELDIRRRDFAEEIKNL